MFFFYTLKEALQSLYTHKSRVLSMGFGVLWAIFILTLLLATGDSLHRGVTCSFEQYGEKTIILWSNQGIPLPMTEKLNTKFDHIKQVSPMLMRNQVGAHYESNKEIVKLFGVDACYASLANMRVKEGRFFSTRDETTAQNLCLLGARIKEKLFRQTTALGKYVCIDGVGMRVIGILDDLGNNMQGEQDYVWVTNSFAKKAFLQQGLFVSAIRFTLVPTADDKAVEQQLRSYFLRHLPNAHDKQTLGLFNMAAYAHKFHVFFKNLTIGSWIIGICFLITGIVGITNMMLVMVQDRRQELSIRRILGARSREIIAMILWEAVIVTFLAGLLGLLGGYTLLHLLNKYIVPLLKNYYMTPLSCSFRFILRGFGFILLSSGAAAIYPVVRALKIRPIEGLNDSL